MLRFRPRSWRGRISGGALAVALLSAISGCTAAPAASVGDPVPAYQARSLDGEAVTLAGLHGEVVLLNVWATWCYPCRREMPAIEALHRELGGDGLAVVAVSIDGAGAEPEIRAFLEEFGISFAVLHDPEQRIVRAFATRGVPETFLIDRDGTLLRHWIGRIDAHSPAVRVPIYEALDRRVALARQPMPSR